MFWKVKPTTISQIETATLIRMAKAEHHADVLEDYAARLEDELAAKNELIAALREEAEERTAHFAARVAELEKENAEQKARLEGEKNVCEHTENQEGARPA